MKKLLIAALIIVFCSSVSAQSGVKIPDNITVELNDLEGDFYTHEGLFTGTLTQTDFPYIVAEREDTFTGLISYGDFLQLEKSGKDISMTQANTGFLIPLTRGDHETVEGKRDSIEKRTLLQEAGPSFSYPELTEPVVRIALQIPYRIDGFQETVENRRKIKVENKDLKGNELVISFRLE